MVEREAGNLIWVGAANSMAVSGLSLERHMIGTGRVISVLICLNGLREMSCLKPSSQKELKLGYV